MIDVGVGIPNHQYYLSDIIIILYAKINTIIIK